MTPGWDVPLGVPALDGGGRDVAELGGHRPYSTEFLENAGHQAASCNVQYPHISRTLDVRQSHSRATCDFRIVPVMDADGIIEALKRYNVPHDEIALAIGRDRTVATKMFGGKKPRKIQVNEIPALLGLVAKYEEAAGDQAHIVRNNQLDPTAAGRVVDYVAVKVLPTYAGMGGGGSGEGDELTALLPRSLVEDELRADPADLLVINVRGDSMEPLFQHGDQLVIDRRDQNPVQPGPFALWFDDGYVVKNVERIRKTGRLHIFSSNPAYSPDEADPGEVQIMGRPVWFARRL